MTARASHIEPIRKYIQDKFHSPSNLEVVPANRPNDCLYVSVVQTLLGARWSADYRHRYHDPNGRTLRQKQIKEGLARLKLRCNIGFPADLIKVASL